MREAGFSPEMMDHLDAYLQGRAHVADLLEWEAGLSLSSEIPLSLRSDLDRIALIGEEVESGLRDEAELRELARRILGGLVERARAS